jgi:hypothetical protein
MLAKVGQIRSVGKGQFQPAGIAPNKWPKLLQLRLKDFLVRLWVYRLDLCICNANIIAHNKPGRHAVKTVGGQFPKISKTSNSPIPYATPVTFVYYPKFWGRGL